MDNDEDDDSNFTKWMSSYWGHNASEEQQKERRHSFNRQSRSRRDRRASLPCPSQLDTMQLHHLQAATMAPTPVHLKVRDEKETRPQPRASWACSDGTSGAKTPQPDKRITTIPELAETFERKLRFRSRNVMSLSDADDLCLICHDDLRNNRDGVRELHCSHRFHKQCIEQWLWKKQTCPNCRVHVVMPEPLYWSSTHLKVP